MLCYYDLIVWLDIEVEEVKSQKDKVDEELAVKKKSVASLNKDLDKLKKVAEGWEKKYWEEHAYRAKWEESGKSLKDKYEDEEVNISARTFNFCKEGFESQKSARI